MGRETIRLVLLVHFVSLVHFGIAAQAPRLRSLLARGRDERARRPIITGCLAECGPEEQSCVTDCQVCVERERCGRLDADCVPCVQVVRESRKRSGSEDITGDSGGAALVHEAIRAHLKDVQLAIFASRERLHKAREEISTQQREVERASEERHRSADRLEDAKRELKARKREEHEADLRHAKKMKRMRAHAAKRRTERMKSEDDLNKAKHRLSKAKRRLAEVREPQLGSGDLIDNAIRRTRLEHETAKLEREVRARRRDVAQAEAALERQRRVRKGAGDKESERVETQERRVKEAKHDLRAAHALERISHDRLQRAKTRYRKSLAATERLDRIAERLKVDLAAHPLPTYVPQEEREALTTTGAAGGTADDPSQ